ncbi:MAG TPA: hypothetical protein ENN51_07205 [candidate division WOR-3 bacterium]|uniref:N-acetyltransferase domain-containing protein n=1 Tax=candidate division WOR-3 bacterium TaxID=2052148 RepID=A0A7V0T6F8_UNCW3|nr:hypothetical protein [candidate division WOR-3 bacterium]
MDHRMTGLCVTAVDDRASHELNRRVFRIRHLLALGRPAEQALVKGLLVRDSMRQAGRRACFVARIPGTDLAGINALERLDYTLSNTSLTLVRDLSEYVLSAGQESATTGTGQPYEVRTAEPVEVEAALNETADQIPDGLLGWDLRLSPRAAARVHGAWLRDYANNGNLLIARDGRRPVGLLAVSVAGRETARMRTDTTRTLGFSVGSVDLVATAHEYRGNGVVPRLLGDVLDEFKRNGIRYAQVSAPTSETPLIAHCQRQGFTVVGSTLTLTHQGQA